MALGIGAAPLTHGVTDARRFDLHDLGAEIRQELPAEGTGDELAHFEHTDSV